MLYEIWQKIRLWWILEVANTGDFKLYLDDERKLPNDSWYLVRDPVKFIEIYEKYQHRLTHISLDHDLGHKMTGYDVMLNLEYLAHNNLDPILATISVHSANPVGRAKMIQTLKNLERHGLYSPSPE